MVCLIEVIAMPCDALQPNDLPPRVIGWQGESVRDDDDAELDRQNRHVGRMLITAGRWPEELFARLAEHAERCR